MDVSTLLSNFRSEFDGIVRYQLDEHHNPWFCAKDIGKVLGINGIRAVVSNYDSSDKRLFSLETTGGKQKILYISINGLKRLLSRSRKSISVEFAKALGIDVSYVKYTCIENDVLKAIKETFHGEDMLEQYRVDAFLIDLYMPKFNLAIECDENAHNFTQKKDKQREDKIKSTLPNIKFIRLYPDDKEFNIYKSINTIYRHIITYQKEH
jgi:very-short-patch-repair endonuclease